MAGLCFTEDASESVGEGASKVEVVAFDSFDIASDLADIDVASGLANMAGGIVS